MRITVSPAAGAAILILDGELSSNTSPEFRKRILALIDQGTPNIIIDCALLTYVSSAGLRVFYEALDRIEAKDGKIHLTRINEDVRQIFQMVNMTADFPTFATNEEAIRSLGFN